MMQCFEIAELAKNLKKQRFFNVFALSAGAMLAHFEPKLELSWPMLGHLGGSESILLARYFKMFQNISR